MAEDQEPEQEGPTPAWQHFLYAAGSIGLAILVFFLLKNMEETGQGGRMNAIIVLLYKIGGKWTAAGVLFGLGVLFAVLGFIQLAKGQDESEDEDRPRRKRPRKRADDDEDEEIEPPPRKRPRRIADEEEDEERPRRKRPPPMPAAEDDEDVERPPRKRPRRRETEE